MAPPDVKTYALLTPVAEPSPPFAMRILALLTALLLVVGVTTAALHGSSGAASPSPAAALGGAVGKIAASKTFHLALTASISGLPPPMPSMTITGDGAIDMAARWGTISIHSGGGSPLRDEKLVVTPNAIYLQSPKDATRWIKLPIPTSTSAAGQGLSLGDPSAILDMLSKSGAAVTRDGTEVVRGVGTTRYRVDVSSLLSTAGAKNLSLSHVMIWIDDAGRMRRVSGTVQLPLGGVHPAIHVSVDLFDFGIAVPDPTPPATETDPAASMIPAPSAACLAALAKQRASATTFDRTTLAALGKACAGH